MNLIAILLGSIITTQSTYTPDEVSNLRKFSNLIEAKHVSLIPGVSEAVDEPYGLTYSVRPAIRRGKTVAELKEGTATVPEKAEPGLLIAQSSFSEEGMMTTVMSFMPIVDAYGTIKGSALILDWTSSSGVLKTKLSKQQLLIQAAIWDKRASEINASLATAEVSSSAEDRISRRKAREASKVGDFEGAYKEIASQYAKDLSPIELQHRARSYSLEAEAYRILAKSRSDKPFSSFDTKTRYSISIHFGKSEDAQIAFKSFATCKNSP